MRTKGKAGYLVWKFAGGQGDQDINLDWDWLDEINFFVFNESELLSANPLLIRSYIKINSNKNKKEECKKVDKFLFLRDYYWQSLITIYPKLSLIFIEVI